MAPPLSFFFILSSYTHLRIFLVLLYPVAYHIIIIPGRKHVIAVPVPEARHCRNCVRSLSCAVNIPSTNDQLATPERDSRLSSSHPLQFLLN